MDMTSPEHEQRLERARLSLEGVAIGDAFGEMFFSRPDQAGRCVKFGELPPGPWWRTDDTEMALSIVDVLSRHGRIEPDALATAFAARFAKEPHRGYGSMASRILSLLVNGEDWRRISPAVFGGRGSMGNGAAMRVAPLGAYFADDIDAVVREAKASAIITHAHPEGQAGAIAVAVAAAAAWSLRGRPKAEAAAELLKQVYDHTPEGETRCGIRKAAVDIPWESSPREAAQMLGRGTQVTAPDTVPYVIWSATHYLDNFVDALVNTVSVGGDCDTNCAMVGGIVALYAGADSIPPAWKEAREPF